MDEEAINRIKKLLKDKSDEVRKLAESSGGQALETGGEKLQALLAAVPGSEEVRILDVRGCGMIC